MDMAGMGCSRRNLSVAWRLKIGLASNRRTTAPILLFVQLYKMAPHTPTTRVRMHPHKEWKVVLSWNKNGQDHPGLAPLVCGHADAGLVHGLRVDTQTPGPLSGTEKHHLAVKVARLLHTAILRTAYSAGS